MTRSRHTVWVAALAAQVGGAVTGPDEARWLDQAETEHANIRTALERLPPGDPTALRIATDLSWFWDVRGHLRGGRAHLERLLSVPVADPAVRAGALDALGRLATYQSDHATADAALQESALLSLALDEHPTAAWTLATLALSAAFTGRIADASPLAERAVALARPGGGSPLGRSLCALFVVRMLQGRHAEATATFADTLASLDDICIAPVTWARARTLYFGGWAAHLRGDGRTAEALLRESALMLDAIGDRRSMADCRLPRRAGLSGGRHRRPGERAAAHHCRRGGAGAVRRGPAHPPDEDRRACSGGGRGAVGRPARAGRRGGPPAERARGARRRA